MEKRVFSGIQPTGNLHLGNYLGAIRHWVKGQNEGHVFCVVDLHAITVDQDPSALREKTLEVAGLIVASGINPQKCLLFVQSHNPDHANLGWILNCYLSMGQMSRMTQYKEKSEGKESVSVGLFDYPALMAADILLYDTTEVPVGDDQKQHVELTRDVAERFNSRCGDTFVLPTAVIPKTGGKVMSLTSPEKKMSKSDVNPNGAINLLDSRDQIEAKIREAVTDSEGKIVYDKNRLGIANLMEIYSLVTAESFSEIEEKFKGKGYGAFKGKLAEVIVGLLEPIQKKYYNLRKNGELEKILSKGAEKSFVISHKKLELVYEKVGFLKYDHN